MSRDTDLELLIALLNKELGRLPTEQEVFGFIYGNEEQRTQILRGKNA